MTSPEVHQGSPPPAELLAQLRDAQGRLREFERQAAERAADFERSRGVVFDIPPSLRVAPEGLAKLREPFPESKIGKLPRVICRDCRERKCNEHRVEWCDVCRQKIGAHIHLDYVGHALVTEKLLDADPTWWWEPVAWETDGPRAGLPRFVRRTITVGYGEKRREIPECPVGLWAWLHVAGTKTLGYGSLTDLEAAEDPEKKLISDFVRSAGMRRGIALELWSKEGLIYEGREEEPAAPPPSKAPKDKRPAAEKKLEAATRTQVEVGSSKAADAARSEMGRAFEGPQEGAGSTQKKDGPRTVFGIPVSTTWPEARKEPIGDMAAKFGRYPPVPDLAKRTWEWAAAGSSQGARELWLEDLVNRAREKHKTGNALLWDHQRALLAYQAMQDRFATAPINEGDA